MHSGAGAFVWLQLHGFHNATFGVAQEERREGRCTYTLSLDEGSHNMGRYRNTLPATFTPRCAAALRLCFSWRGLLRAVVEGFLY